MNKMNAEMKEKEKEKKAYVSPETEIVSMSDRETLMAASEISHPSQDIDVYEYEEEDSTELWF